MEDRERIQIRYSVILRDCNGKGRVAIDETQWADGEEEVSSKIDLPPSPQALLWVYRLISRNESLNHNWKTLAISKLSQK